MLSWIAKDKTGATYRISIPEEKVEELGGTVELIKKSFDRNAYQRDLMREKRAKDPNYGRKSK